MQPVDESVRFVEFVTKAGHPAPGNHSSVTLHSPRAAFSRFHLFRDFVDVGVQRLQQLPRLRRVGFIDHVGIIASTPTMCAPRSDRPPGSFDVVPSAAKSLITAGK
jgi:hypothetical protein